MRCVAAFHGDHEVIGSVIACVDHAAVRVSREASRFVIGAS
jgi:hypothetical protein